jgi:hypothetical protein
MSVDRQTLDHSPALSPGSDRALSLEDIQKTFRGLSPGVVAVAASLLMPSCQSGEVVLTPGTVPTEEGDVEQETDDTGGGDTGDETDPDPDGDGRIGDADCDETDGTVYEGAPELCDEKDNDCDGEVDEDPTDPTSFYPDGDGDGFGVDGESIADCEAPDGFVDNADDCNDENAEIHPDAVEGETCDNLDNNCDDEIDNLDNGNECELVVANLSAQYPGGWQESFFAAGTSSNPNEICLDAVAGEQADMALATWWGECGGPGRLDQSLLAEDLTFDWSTVTSCTGETFAEDNAHGWSWEPNMVVTSMSSTFSAYEGPDGTSLDPGSTNPGWDMALLCQVVPEEEGDTGLDTGGH